MRGNGRRNMFKGDELLIQSPHKKLYYTHKSQILLLLSMFQISRKTRKKANWMVFLFHFSIRFILYLVCIELVGLSLEQVLRLIFISIWKPRMLNVNLIGDWVKRVFMTVIILMQFYVIFYMLRVRLVFLQVMDGCIPFFHYLVDCLSCQGEVRITVVV